MAWEPIKGLKYEVSETAWKEAQSFLARVGATLSTEDGWLVVTNHKGKQRRSKNIYNIVVAGLQMDRPPDGNVLLIIED